MKDQKIKIKIEEHLDLVPADIYLSKVVKSGTGAVINSYKKYIGKEVVVIMANKIKKQIKMEEKKDEKKQFEEDLESASPEGWEKAYGSFMVMYLRCIILNLKWEKQLGSN